jgi:hypothetical protein
MHTLSTRALSALAFDRGEEYDPAMSLSPGLLADLELIARARPITCDVSLRPRQRGCAHEGRDLEAQVPEWFSPDDLLARPWELVHHEPV